MNSHTLIQKCQGFTEGSEKLSGVISNRAAAASRPTTAGRKPMNTHCTVVSLLKRQKIYIVPSTTSQTAYVMRQTI